MARCSREEGPLASLDRCCQVLLSVQVQVLVSHSSPVFWCSRGEFASQATILTTENSMCYSSYLALGYFFHFSKIFLSQVWNIVNPVENCCSKFCPLSKYYLFLWLFWKQHFCSIDHFNLLSTSFDFISLLASHCFF